VVAVLVAVFFADFADFLAVVAADFPADFTVAAFAPEARTGAEVFFTADPRDAAALFLCPLVAFDVRGDPDATRAGTTRLASSG
jgi:hypothetical protein